MMNPADMNDETQLVIIVLDYVNGYARAFPFRGDADEAFHRWCDVTGTRASSCEWMATTLNKVKLS